VVLPCNECFVNCTCPAISEPDAAADVLPRTETRQHFLCEGVDVREEAQETAAIARQGVTAARTYRASEVVTAKDALDTRVASMEKEHAARARALGPGHTCFLHLARGTAVNCCLSMQRQAHLLAAFFWSSTNPPVPAEPSSFLVGDFPYELMPEHKRMKLSMQSERERAHLGRESAAARAADLDQGSADSAPAAAMSGVMSSSYKDVESPSVFGAVGDLSRLIRLAGPHMRQFAAFYAKKHSTGAFKTGDDQKVCTSTLQPCVAAVLHGGRAPQI
jgi:hypothetical protein